jgi:uncharacterized protein YgbK (DUF1537 family)
MDKPEKGNPSVPAAPAGRQVPAVAYYGDDFTGSTDTLAAAVNGGWRAALFLDVPTQDDLRRFGPLDCVGVAGAARAMSPEEMQRELPRIYTGLAATGAPILHYKTCSTFDSAPHIGSIGRAIALARQASGAHPAYIVGGQPNLGRYCAYANLYARNGQDGAIFRIDRHPTMRHHPVTPMDEADLRVHLGRQDLAPVVSFDSEMLALPAADRIDALQRLLDGDPAAILFDVMRDADLAAVGELLWRRCATQGRLLAVGPTGVTQALLAARPALHAEEAATREAPGRGRRQPVSQTFIVAGSRSPVTAAQIRAAEQAGFESVPLDPGALARGDAVYAAELVARLAYHLGAGRSVVAHTTFADVGSDGGPDYMRALAQASGRLMADVLARHPLARVGFAGGDTSSLAVQCWSVRALTLSYVLSPGVAVCRVHAPGAALDGIELMLKGGQMGPPDLFDALRRGVSRSPASR